MTEMAKLIRIERHPGRNAGATLWVDGQEFPWHVALGVTVEVNREEVPGVTLKLLADRVEVVDDFGSVVTDDISGD